jgi:hypothetical protein
LDFEAGLGDLAPLLLLRDFAIAILINYNEFCL